MKPEKKYTEHVNPRKTFGTSPKKVKHDANTREAEEEIRAYQNGTGSTGDFLPDLPPPRSHLG